MLSVTVSVDNQIILSPCVMSLLIILPQSLASPLDTITKTRTSKMYKTDSLLIPLSAYSHMGYIIWEFVYMEMCHT